MKKIKSLKLEEFLNEVAVRKPTPGGGAVAAVAGAMAASLVEMIACYSKEKFEEVAEKANGLRKKLLKLADDDCLAYQEVVKTKGNQEAIKKAALVPLESFKVAKEVLGLARLCLRDGNKRLVSDAKVAIALAQAAIKGAKENIIVNLKEIDDREFHDIIKTQIRTLDKPPN